MKEQRTPENAKEAMRMISEIVSVDRTSKTAIFKRLGITGESTVMIARELGCTTQMLERIRTEHARVCGSAAASKAAKSGLIVAPREEPAPAAEEPEEEIEEEIEEEGEDEDESGESDEDADESEPAPPPKPARATPVRAKASAAKPAPKPSPSPSPALSLSQEQMLEVLVQLTRCAAAVERLGGIERAERIAAAIGGAP